MKDGCDGTWFGDKSEGFFVCLELSSCGALFLVDEDTIGRVLLFPALGLAVVSSGLGVIRFGSTSFEVFFVS